jgi:hypothetical protein
MQLYERDHMLRLTGGAASYLLAGCLLACSSGGDAGPIGEGGNPVGAGGAGGHGGGGCPLGSHDAGDGTCDSTLTMAGSPVTISPKRDHHTTLVAELDGKAFVYVFGGGTDQNETIYDDIQRAPIAEDGSLGAFETIGKLPEPRLGHTTVLVGDRIIVSGGLSAFLGQRHLLTSTTIATLEQDGRLGPWMDGPDLPVPVMHHTCDAEGTRIYCVGGRIDGNFTSDLAVRTELGSDGTLAPYAPVSPLPQTVAFHQAFVRGGGLYIAGGLHRDAPAPSFDLLSGVLRAGIASDGTLGPWQEAGQLPVALNIGAAQPFGDRVYFLGGMDPDQWSWTSVLAASFDAAGTIADVTSVAELTTTRMHMHQAPVYRRWIYAVAGRDETEASLTSVEVGTFE